jgi:hypothetical protein
MTDSLLSMHRPWVQYLGWPKEKNQNQTQATNNATNSTVPGAGGA